jgi:hypothetical protein
LFLTLIVCGAYDVCEAHDVYDVCDACGDSGVFCAFGYGVFVACVGDLFGDVDAFCFHHEKLDDAYVGDSARHSPHQLEYLLLVCKCHQPFQ